MKNLKTKMEFKQDIATLEYYIRKKDKIERICFILCNDNGKYKIQQVEPQSRERITLAESKYKQTALKLFSEIFTNDIKEFTKTALIYDTYLEEYI